MKLWDYTLLKNWCPRTADEWQWFLERKINYGDFKGLKATIVKKYWRRLRLDEGKRLMIKSYFKLYGVK